MSIVIDTNGDHVERVAWTHGVPVEADATHKFATYAGVTYRAALIGVEA